MNHGARRVKRGENRKRQSHRKETYTEQGQSLPTRHRTQRTPVLSLSPAPALPTCAANLAMRRCSPTPGSRSSPPRPPLAARLTSAHEKDYSSTSRSSASRAHVVGVEGEMGRGG
ncbi:hypothetical protein FA13DRAFT_1738419 [Coprinellus micaceus]|uniref:Uncharacterized protein n=1 Tax=Coprinellus micaceus TaxID=71717 RepID=A0A4Y7STR9_COPMI|nr:hypothetical protein FA13DRAFT_1738419 [Coprinellus micaceus]